MNTSPKIIFIVVCSMSLYVVLGLFAVVYLILEHVDAALIAVVAGFTGTALGSLNSVLNNTRTPSADQPPIEARIVNTDKDPAITKDAKK